MILTWWLAAKDKLIIIGIINNTCIHGKPCKTHVNQFSSQRAAGEVEGAEGRTHGTVAPSFQPELPQTHHFRQQTFVFHIFRFRSLRFRTEARGTPELRLGEPGAGGSHLQGRAGEPEIPAGGTGAGARHCRRIKDIEKTPF